MPRSSVRCSEPRGHRTSWSAPRAACPGSCTGTGRPRSPSAITSSTDFPAWATRSPERSEEHTSGLQSQSNLVCRLLLEKKKNKKKKINIKREKKKKIKKKLKNNFKK